MPSEQDENSRRLIEDIRSDYLGDSGRSKINQRNACDRLSIDLYDTKSHFIFELIQNAEDNIYREDERPALWFRVRDITLSEQPCTVFVVQNNEVGFTNDQVDALCSIGVSTKKMAPGYIGEKGIGFKSVFQVTECPHIYSNGFQFCLPKFDPDTGLGYIVPRWLDHVPDVVRSPGTTILLPLEDGACKSVTTELDEIAAETILFLTKLKTIEIEVALPDASYESIIEKDDSRTPHVKLSHLKRQQGHEQQENRTYWVAAREFVKPVAINPDKRPNVTTRKVSVAIHLDGGEHPGKLFAYLPVWERTGLPFLINADFLLTSSREGLHEQDPWNLWLRDCIAPVYTEAFVAIVGNGSIPVEQRAQAYASIPTQAHEKWLEPVVQKIQDRLRHEECVITGPAGTLARPEFCRLPGKEWRELLETGDTRPAALGCDLSFVHAAVASGFAGLLEKIGVQRLLQCDVVACLKDSGWLSKRTDEWLVRLYRNLKPFKNGTLADLRLVPAVALRSRKRELHCPKEYPVYFRPDRDNAIALRSIPAWLRKAKPVAFLPKPLQRLIDQCEDHEKLNEWLTEEQHVYPFSAANYCVDVLEYLQNQKDRISKKRLIDTTKFLVEHAGKDLDWSGLPIVLADNATMTVREVRELTWSPPFHIQGVVVPESHNPKTGWQHIWRTDQDRQHFRWLARCYSQKVASGLVKRGVIDSAPEFRTQRSQYTPRSVREVEVKHLAPSTLVEPDCHASAALVEWLSSSVGARSLRWPGNNSWPFCGPKEPDYEWAINLKFYMQENRLYHIQTGHYEFKCKYSEVVEHLRQKAWLPTTKGLVRPSLAFLSKPETKDVLGDTVPYFEGDLPDDLLKLFGVNTSVTVDTLLKRLDACRNDSAMNARLPEKIYRQLASRTQERGDWELRSKFEKQPLVSFPDRPVGQQWLTSKDCVWQDARELFGDSFGYLEKTYPRFLRDFFVDALGVKASVDVESYAQRWLQMQTEQPAANSSRQEAVKSIYLKIRDALKAQPQPEWLRDFLRKAQIYTQTDTFEDTSCVLVPDDGNLKRLFENEVAFAWRPDHDAFSDWQPLYEALEVCRLSECVDTELDLAVQSEPICEDRLTTPECVQMIASWLREKERKAFDRLLKDEVFKRLFCAQEERSESPLRVVYTLNRMGEDPVQTSEEVSVFWDKDGYRLVIGPDVSDGDIKPAAARQLARFLLSGPLDEHGLASWIELTFGTIDTRRLKDNNWSVPREILNLSREQASSDGVADCDSQLKAGNAALSSVPGPIDTPVTPRSAAPPQSESPTAAGPPYPPAPVQGRPGSLGSRGAVSSSKLDRKAGSSPVESDEGGPQRPEPAADYAKMLSEAFNHPGEIAIDEDFCVESGTDGEFVRDPERRARKLAEQHRERMANEPSSDERRRTTERTLLEPADPQVRQALLDWYGGKCQICGRTWPERDGHPFFVAARLVERRNAHWLDDPANAICLCADHFAQWRHAAKQEPLSVAEQLRSLAMSSDGGLGKLSILFKMLGQDVRVTYCEKHMMALQKLIDISEGNDSE